MNNQATNGSFWRLINHKKIEIPNYQREYAQGRDNRRAKGIRMGLVEALYSALKSNTALELDFIFGGKEGGNVGEFHPVDGQQRLTILYLLHWYLFQRTDDEDALGILKEHFLYATRTTSRTFCENICKSSSLNWNEDKLSVQLKDRPWFTGAMGYDPTVRSMLVVLDCIHDKFCKERDFTDFANKLKGEDCPITFYYYDLSDNGVAFNVRDLYIKMNARGLPLTDFEIFKAELQKNVPSGSGFDLLKKYHESLEIKDSSAERVKLIGEFNNEYTNFFFDLINGEDTTSEKFDQAMMNFINEIFRADFFCSVSKKGVSQKNYRYDHDTIKCMSGKEFYNFIKDSGEPLIGKYIDSETTKVTQAEAQEAFTSSMKRIIMLLDLFSKNSQETIFTKNYSRKIGYALFDDLIVGDKDVSGLAVDPFGDKTLSFGDFVARNALYAFLEKFSIPKDEDSRNKYEEWNRFVWKIVHNANFKGFNEAVETLRGLRQICKEISTSVYDVLSRIEEVKDEHGELTGVFKFNDGKLVVMGSPARLQFEEELLKAKHIADDNKWEQAIKEVEDYFSANGQIWFLLDLAKEGDVCDSNCVLNKFNTAATIAKKLFDKDKNLTVSPSLFERALLAVGADDNAFKDKDHLEQMSKMARKSKKFIGKDFHEHLSHRYAVGDTLEKDRYDVTIALLKTMVDEKVQNINVWLEDYIKNAKNKSNFADLPEWKKIFIQYDLLNKNVEGVAFQNCFEPEVWSEDSSAIAIYKTSTKRINSGELHSFALALEIQNELPEGSNMKYYFSDDEKYLENSFPNRYFTIECPDKKTLKIGYMNGEFVTDSSGASKISGTIGEAHDKLCERLGI